MSQQDMDLLKDAIAGVLAKTNGFENAGPFEQEQASRVYARVVAPALARVEASRRDWAAIAMAHDMAAEFQAVGTLDDPWPEPPAVGAPCSCLTAEQAAVVVDGGFSLPLCAVHPEAGR